MEPAKFFFHLSHTYRTIRSASSLWIGRPQPRWYQLIPGFSALLFPPPPTDLPSEFYKCPTSAEVSDLHGGSLHSLPSWFNNTPLYSTVISRAHRKSSRIDSFPLQRDNTKHNHIIMSTFLSNFIHPVFFLISSSPHLVENKQAGAEGSVQVLFALEKNISPNSKT